MNNDSIFGEVIHHYSRTQAIADGVLLDVTETACELGFRTRVAVTAAAWTLCVASQGEQRRHMECAQACAPGYTLRLEQGGGAVELVAQRLCIGPGGEGE